MFVYVFTDEKRSCMVSATEQGAEPLPLSVTPMPPDRNTATGFVYATFWCTQESGWVSSGTLLPFSALRKLDFCGFGFLFSWVEVNKLGSWTAGELPCQPLGLVILQQAAEAVTSECKVRTVSPAGILPRDWLLLCCAGRENFGTTASVLLVVCNPAAKSLLFPA